MTARSAQRPWKRAAAWLALLGPLFYATYGFANGWAASRPHVPTLAFDWERGLPFWPWTIFPYWSINVFYALSPFLARDRHTLDRHVFRLISATVLAVACFLLWPLRFSFGLPEVSGAPAFLFDALRGFDQPFNQAPSLHIALAVILWDWYRRLLRPLWARVALHVWTLLICASVLTTWQHHFIDIPTGALLGLACVWLWPLERVVSPLGGWRMTHDPQRWMLAALYAAVACALLTTALRYGGVALWLGWPAMSLALVALNYGALGARGFQMDPFGRMRWAARWLFGPYRCFAKINAWAWTHRSPASVEVLPGLRLGRLPTQAEWHAAGRPRLVSLCAELQVPGSAAQARARCVPMLDLVVPPPHRLQRAIAAIETQRRSGDTVWVCCALGFSRGAASMIGWLSLHGAIGGPGTAGDDAEARVRHVRPQTVLRAAWRTAIDRATAPPHASSCSSITATTRFPQDRTP